MCGSAVSRRKCSRADAGCGAARNCSSMRRSSCDLACEKPSMACAKAESGNELMIRIMANAIGDRAYLIKLVNLRPCQHRERQRPDQARRKNDPGLDPLVLRKELPRSGG